ncbi:MAG: hypothetical protein ACR5K5_03605 [Wolbachia sp.]
MRNNSLEFIGSLNPQLYKHYDLSLSGGCHSSAQTLESRKKNGVIPVPRLLGSRKLNSTSSKCTIRTRFQTGISANPTSYRRGIP